MVLRLAEPHLTAFHIIFHIISVKVTRAIDVNTDIKLRA